MRTTYYVDYEQATRFMIGPQSQDVPCKERLNQWQIWEYFVLRKDLYFCQVHFVSFETYTTATLVLLPHYFHAFKLYSTTLL